MGFDAGVSVVLGVPGLAPAIGNLVVGQLEPGGVTELSRPLRGLLSFLLVLVAGTVVLRLRQGYIDESIDAIFDSPATAILYGFAGYVIVGIVSLYGTTTLARLSVAGGVLVRILIIIWSLFLLLLTAFGFVVVGPLLTDILRSRHTSYGLLIGASLSAVSWVLFSPVGSIVASLAIAAFGIGGSARLWIHAERTVETELDAD
jgi:hypothetical protein